MRRSKQTSKRGNVKHQRHKASKRQRKRKQLALRRRQWRRIKISSAKKNQRKAHGA